MLFINWEIYVVVMEDKDLLEFYILWFNFSFELIWEFFSDIYMLFEIVEDFDWIYQQSIVLFFFQNQQGYRCIEYFFGCGIYVKNFFQKVLLLLYYYQQLCIVVYYKVIDVFIDVFFFEFVVEGMVNVVKCFIYVGVNVIFFEGS